MRQKARVPARGPHETKKGEPNASPSPLPAREPRPPDKVHKSASHASAQHRPLSICHHFFRPRCFRCIGSTASSLLVAPLRSACRPRTRVATTSPASSDTLASRQLISAGVAAISSPLPRHCFLAPATPRHLVLSHSWTVLSCDCRGKLRKPLQTAHTTTCLPSLLVHTAGLCAVDLGMQAALLRLT